MISVIIPHHDENFDKIKGLLDMLYNQVGIGKDEYEVLLCNDDPDAIIEDLSRWEGMNIRNLIVNGSGNPGLSRQVGIDNASGEWLIFCDADDMISNIYALNDLNIFTKQNQCDAIAAPFVEEVRLKEGNSAYITHTKEFTWMFSKIYRKDFLVANNIRFSPKFAVHEDSYFNAIFKACNPKILMMKQPFYLWKYNENSITRRNDAAYSYNSLTIFIDALQDANDEILKRNIKDITPGVCQIEAYIYSVLQTEQFKRPEFKAYVPEIEKKLYQFMEHFRIQNMNAKPEMMAKVLQDEFIKNSGSGLFYVSEAWPDFLKRLKATYGVNKQ